MMMSVCLRILHSLLLLSNLANFLEKNKKRNMFHFSDRELSCYRNGVEPFLNRKKKRLPTWYVGVKKGFGLQIKAFKREDGSRIILIFGQRRRNEGVWVDDTQPFFLGPDRVEELIKALQEALAAIKD